MYIYSHNDNKRNDKPKIFLAVVLTTFITVVVIENIIILMNNEREDNIVQRLSAERTYYNGALQGYSSNSENSASFIIDNMKKSIVGISLLKPEGENIFDINAEEKWGMGTGIIVSRNGYILTNEHLAKTIGAKLVVSLPDGNTTQGRVIWNEKNIDLAIIKIDKKNLDAASLGNSSNLYVGDDVIAIGNPLGIEFQGTTTKGIVSGLNRTFTFEENGKQIFMEGLVQTDASINPGNSGGPLINMSGQVVGVNTVKLTEAEGIGFAVPINIVKPIIDKLEKDDKFEEATLGIYAYDKEAIPYMNSKVKLDKGIYVSSIDKYGPCGITDLKVGDIIVSIDNVELNKMTELREYIYSKQPNDEVILHVIDGEEKDIKVKLRKKMRKREMNKGDSPFCSSCLHINVYVFKMNKKGCPYCSNQSIHCFFTAKYAWRFTFPAWECTTSSFRIWK